MPDTAQWPTIEIALEIWTRTVTLPHLPAMLYRGGGALLNFLLRFASISGCPGQRRAWLSAIVNFPNLDTSGDVYCHAVLFPCAYEFNWNWTIGCWVITKNDFKRVALCHLGFKKIVKWSSGCHRVPNLLLCTKFHQNRIDFSLWYDDFMIFKMSDIRYLEC